MLTEKILMWVNEEYRTNGRGRLLKAIDRALKKQVGGKAVWKGSLILLSLDKLTNILTVDSQFEDTVPETIDYDEFRTLLGK